MVKGVVWEERGWDYKASDPRVRAGERHTMQQCPLIPTGWGPLVISRVIRALNWVIRTLS